MVWASTSTKIQQILQSTALGKPAETRSLTAERVATLLAQLKEKQELRSIQTKHLPCNVQRQPTQLYSASGTSAPLDRQNCKNCNALLLRLESHQRSHQSWITKSNLIALCCFAFEFYIAIMVTVRSLLCREARRCGRRISMRSSLSQKHSMGQQVSGFSLFECLVCYYSSS